MLYKNLIYKISVVLIIAVLLLSGCSFLPEITIDRPLQIDEDDYNRIIEAGDIQEELTDDNESITEQEQESRLTITAVGDIMMHMPQVRAAMQPDGSYDFRSVFHEVKYYLERADITIGNLETTIGPPEKGYSGYPRFRSPEEILEALKYAGFDVLVTANNHSLDALEFGLEYTLDELDKYGFMYTGTARSIEEKNKHLIVEKNNIRVGILSYTYGTNGMEAAVSQEKLKYMVNYYNDYNQVVNDINSINAESVDLLIAYMHWGYEYHRTPNDEQKNLTELLAKEGVDIIFGSHPHVIQPMEIKQVTMEDGTEKDVLVAYSLGNFVSNQRDQYTDSGVIVNVEIIKNNDGVSIDRVSYVPTWVHRYEQGGKLQYEILPVKEHNDYENLSGEAGKRIQSVWKETTDMLGLEVFKVEY